MKRCFHGLRKEEMLAEFVLTDLENAVFDQLSCGPLATSERLLREAKAILPETLHGKDSSPWAPVDDIYHRLAASGQVFSDSADLLREDRDR